MSVLVKPSGLQYDKAHSGLEDRWQTLGMVNRVLFAVFTERGVKTRIITAREATLEERRIYHGTSKKGNWFIDERSEVAAVLART